MRYRVVVYPPADRGGDDELLAAIAACVGSPLEGGAERLATGFALEVGDLDRETAEQVKAVLDERGVDGDLEPTTLPADRVEFLASEAPKWVRRGLLHRDSLPRIFGNYGLTPPTDAVPPPAPVASAVSPRPHRAVRTGVLLRVVLILGAVLVGLGLILFIAANWRRIPAPVKIGGALALTLVALHAGHHLRYVRRTHARLGAALLLISVFGIGGVVLLIGQTYHVQADSYTLPLLWGALLVPLGVVVPFSPALYITSGLWLWSQWLYQASHRESPWFYAVLLLGVLLPYGLVRGSRLFYRVQLGVLLTVLLSTVVTQSFWQASVYVAALILLRLKFREPLYDWLLLLGFFFWHLDFLVRFDDLPDLFLLLPLAYFVWRARERKANWMMLATVASAEFWLVSSLMQATERFDLGNVSETDFFLWLLGTGLLWVGLGGGLLRADDWRMLARVLAIAGTLLAGAVVYGMSFRFYEDQEVFFESRLFLGAALLSGLAGAVLGLPALATATAGEEPRRGPAILFATMALASLTLSALLPPSSPVHVVLFNLTLFVAAFAMLLRGHREVSLLWFNGGVALFVVWIVSRYFDTFVELLPRSVFFVLGGVFLIVWAVLADRQRRRRLPAGGNPV